MGTIALVHIIIITIQMKLRIMLLKKKRRSPQKSLSTMLLSTLLCKYFTLSQKPRHKNLRVPSQIVIIMIIQLQKARVAEAMISQKVAWAEAVVEAEVAVEAAAGVVHLHAQIASHIRALVVHLTMSIALTALIPAAILPELRRELNGAN